VQNLDMHNEETEREHCERVGREVSTGRTFDLVALLMRERAAARAECEGEIAHANAMLRDMTRNLSDALAKLSALREAADESDRRHDREDFQLVAEFKQALRQRTEERDLHSRDSLKLRAALSRIVETGQNVVDMMEGEERDCEEPYLEWPGFKDFCAALEASK
jgi:hypothetical protein